MTCLVISMLDRSEKLRAISSLAQPDEISPPVRLLLAQALADLPAADAVGAVIARLKLSGILRYIPDPKLFGYDSWCSPATTLARGGGDCDDHAIFARAMFRAIPSRTTGTRAVLGVLNGGGHMWIEGWDLRGRFLLESTSGAVHRGDRHASYVATEVLS